jgi:kumamolisin
LLSAAPLANFVVYFAPNTDQGFLQALPTAIHDAKNNPHISFVSTKD